MRIISGFCKGRTLKTGKDRQGYRPSTGKTREALFSILESLGIFKNAIKVADLFAGSGIFGLECLSRGAGYVYFVEHNLDSVKLLAENIRNFNLSSDKFNIQKKDVLYFISRLPNNSLNLVFMDPPYNQKLCILALEALINENIMCENSIICAEMESNAVLSDFINMNMLLIKERNYGKTKLMIWRKI